MAVDIVGCWSTCLPLCGKYSQEHRWRDWAIGGMRHFTLEGEMQKLRQQHDRIILAEIQEPRKR